MTPSEKQKAIALSFLCYFGRISPSIANEDVYDRWLLTEEGKRLTAEEPEKESSYELLLKISKQFDRFEGRLRGDLFRG